MKRKLAAGTTSVALPIIVADTSSTTGAGLSGLTHTTAGLVLEYRRQGQSSWTAVTLVAGTLGTFISGGIVASGSRPGRYEVCIPDAAFASGARFVEICLRGAANMYPVDIEIELDAVNYQADAFGIFAKGDIDGYTLEDAMKLMLAAMAGKLSGGGTTTITIRAADDSKTRITATVDASGNRSTLTLDATG